MATATYDSELAQRGQLTVPKQLREIYKLHQGQEFTIFDLNGKFLMVPKKSQIDALCNQLRDELLESGASLSDMLEDIRSRREADGRLR
jgi:bifunctional DNA-binding transcriptional regulator/antitoxin component of YhaV-PrlF toxin-antitoxin module